MVTVEHPRDVIQLLVLFLRMLVYEYVDNGNLDQWLHGDVGEVSPLTWDIRMNIILGTAKGYCPYITSLFFFLLHRKEKPCSAVCKFHSFGDFLIVQAGLSS